MLSACQKAAQGFSVRIVLLGVGEAEMLTSAWVSRLPDVHPYLVDLAQLVDRTIARFERRIGERSAELATHRTALPARQGRATDPLSTTQLAAYRQEIADFQATITQCRTQFEAQIARKWTTAEITTAKNEAVGLSVEPQRSSSSGFSADPS